MSVEQEEHWDSDSEDDGSICSGHSNVGIKRYEDQVLKAGVLAPGVGRFQFINPNTLKDITVYYIKSKKYKKEDPPVFVFHGVFRNPDVYRDAWVGLAEEHGLFVLAPYFDMEQFPGTAGYNLGNIFESESNRTAKPTNNWSYRIPEVVFNYLSVEGKGDTTSLGYFAYGHSAGSQYLHRKVAMCPDPKLLMAIASNAGWYTMPTLADLWPYGWGGFEEAGIHLDESHLANFLAAPLYVQLGTEDTDRHHVNLRRTPEAMAQGANRLDRGLTFYRKGQQVAQDKGLPFNWKLKFVEGVGHTSAQMAPAAARYITQYIRNPTRAMRHEPLPPVPSAATVDMTLEDHSAPVVPSKRLDFAIAIHGGAGVISKSDSISEQFTVALSDIIKRCHYFAVDDASRTAVDIAEFAVNLLENNPLFNAGLGAVFTADETHELEASIMEGTALNCGASALLTNVKNPISLARAVMDSGKHVWIAGNPGENLAAKEDLLVADSNDYFSVPRRLAQLERAKEINGVFNDHDSSVAAGEEKKEEATETAGTTETAASTATTTTEPAATAATSVPLHESLENLDDEINTETVGCVCMRGGHVCAATSTGGMTNKSSGRIGDTPMIGCGTYANDKTCAVSATGKGEEFIRHIVAYDISARMEYAKLPLLEACKATVFGRLPSESGGIIAVDAKGTIAMVFNSKGMFRASCNSNGEFSMGIWEEETKWKEEMS